jgi:hypothetical protein
MTEQNPIEIGCYVLTLWQSADDDYQAYLGFKDFIEDMERDLWVGIGKTPELAMKEAVNSWCKYQEQTRGMLEDF